MTWYRIPTWPNDKTFYSYHLVFLLACNCDLDIGGVWNDAWQTLTHWLNKNVSKFAQKVTREQAIALSQLTTALLRVVLFLLHVWCRWHGVKVTLKFPPNTKRCMQVAKVIFQASAPVTFGDGGVFLYPTALNNSSSFHCQTLLWYFLCPLDTIASSNISLRVLLHTPESTSAR